jgi:hypothetical protein
MPRRTPSQSRIPTPPGRKGNPSPERPGNTAGSLQGGFTQPEITDEGEVINKPVETARQALEIFYRFEKDNRARAVKNKFVSDKINGEPPYSQEKLQSQNQGWRANFNTGFIASVVDRIVPRFIDAVHAAKYLTSSKLPISYELSDSKTQVFQTEVTDLIRRWAGWRDYIDTLANENVTYGYTAAVQLDEYDWRPRTFRQEEIYFDEHTKQHAGQLAAFVVRIPYFIHELTAIVAEPEKAQDLGYHVENIIEAIRKAMPPILRPMVDTRELSDMVREASLYYTYHRSVKMVETIHLFASNWDKGVDHWWLNRNEGNVTKSTQKEGRLKAQAKADAESEEDPILFLHEDSDAKSMEDIITLFTFQVGNNRYFGSKGAGRILANIDTAVNRIRMLFIDGCYLSQLFVGRCDGGKVPMLNPIAKFPFMWLPEGVEWQSGMQFQYDPSKYLMLEQRLQQLGEILIGAVLPDNAAMPMQGGEQPSATESAQDFQREQEVKQGSLNRWWRQIQEMVQTMQRRVFNTSNLNAAQEVFQAMQKANKKEQKLIPSEVWEMIMAVNGDPNDLYVQRPDIGEADEDAVDCIMRLLEQDLTIAEIILLARAPAMDTTQYSGAKEAAAYAQFYGSQRQNPNFNGPKMDEMLGVDQIGTDRMKQIYRGDNGAQNQAEQSRQQTQETATMQQGFQVPVSNRDDDMIHLQTAFGQIQSQLEQIKNAPALQITDAQLMSLTNQLQHAQGHVAGLKQKASATPDQIRHAQAQVNDGGKMIQAVQGERAKQQQAVAQAQQAALQSQLESGATGSPPPQPGGNPGPPGALVTKEPPKNGNGTKPRGAPPGRF